MERIIITCELCVTCNSSLQMTLAPSSLYLCTDICPWQNTIWLHCYKLGFGLGKQKHYFLFPSRIIAVKLVMLAIFTGLPTLSTLYDCAPRVLAPLNTEPLLLRRFFPVVPGSCFGLWQPTWSQRLIRPPFGQRSSRGIRRQNEDKRWSRNLWNCLRWCQWKRRQRWLSSSSRSLRWCRLLKGLGLGSGGGGGGMVPWAMLQLLLLLSGIVPCKDPQSCQQAIDTVAVSTP